LSASTSDAVHYSVSFFVHINRLARLSQPICHEVGLPQIVICNSSVQVLDAFHFELDAETLFAAGYPFSSEVLNLFVQLLSLLNCQNSQKISSLFNLLQTIPTELTFEDLHLLQKAGLWKGAGAHAPT